MEEFLKKRLTDYSEAKNGWNIPSEKAWEATVEKFPKRKRRRFIFIGVLMAFLFVLGGFWNSYDDKNPDQVSNTSSTLNSSEKPLFNELKPIITADKNIKTPHERSSVIFKKRLEDITIQDNNITNIKTEINDQEDKNQKESIHLSTSNINQKNSTNLSSNQGGKPNYNISPDHKSINPSRKTKSLSLQSGYNNSLTTSTVLNKRSKSFGELNSSDLVQREEPLHLIDNQLLKAALISSHFDEPPLFNLDQSPFVYAPFSPTSDISKSPLVEKIDIIKNKKWSIGIGFSGYVTSAKPYTIFGEDDLEDLESAFSTSSFQGLNLEFNKRFDDKWSISFGLNSSHQNLDIDLVQKHLWDAQTNKTQSRSSDFIIEDELELIFFDGIEVSDGQELYLNGNVRINTYGLRIPVTANYHINNDRHEYLISAGLSLGFDAFVDAAADILVYRENELIGTDSEAGISGGTLPQASIYGGIGYRYRINQKWKLGVNTFIDKRIGLNGRYYRTELGVFMKL